jgi:YidC/Oxa1 family membrane protein insertase
MYLANVFQPLIDLNEAIMRFFHDDLGFGWGMSIIGLTVVIRLAILPLTFKQVRSMQALQRLQPEMKKLQERYKDDRQRMNEELMKFYREHQVNPLGSCLPLLLQLPFFLALFYTLRDDTFKADVRAGGGEDFLFIPDLTEPVTGHPWVLGTLIVLYVASQLGSSLVSLQTVTDQTQRRIFLALPFVFVIFIINFEAGLIVYWITTNLWTIGQQLFVRRFLPPPEPLPAGATAATAKGGGGGRKGGDGRGPEPARAERKPAKARAGGGDRGDGGPRKPPPRSPRKKKKRSGRRR